MENVMEKVESAVNTIFEDCKADVMREEAFIKDPSKSEYETEKSLVGNSQKREAEKLAAKMILMESCDKILDRFEHIGKVKDIMTENFQLENIIFDVLKDLKVRIPANVYYSTEDNEQHVDYLGFEGDYAKGAYSIKQLAEGLIYAKMKMREEAKDNSILKDRQVFLDNKVSALEEKVKDLQASLSTSENNVRQMSSRPQVKKVIKTAFHLYNEETGKYLAFSADKIDIAHAKVADYASAHAFEDAIVALDFKGKMLDYKRNLVEKFKSKWKDNSKLGVKNPHKFVVVETLVFDRGV